MGGLSRSKDEAQHHLGPVPDGELADADRACAAEPAALEAVVRLDACRARTRLLWIQVTAAAAGAPGTQSFAALENMLEQCRVLEHNGCLRGWAGLVPPTTPHW